MKWKKSLTISISVIILLLSEQIIHACGGGNLYDTYPQFFGNTAPNKPALMPFHFSPWFIYYTIDGADTINGSINKRLILKEWQGFIKNGISQKDINDLLYKSSLATFKNIKQGKKATPENRFVQYLKEKNHRIVLDYLIYAKKCEINATNRENTWSDKKETPAADNEELMNEGLEQLKNLNNDFLRQKYIFQVLRMAFYSKKYQKVLDLYFKLKPNPLNSGVASTRIIGLKAGAYYHLGNKVKAAYYFSRMFDNSNAYKFNAMIGFQWALNYNGHNNLKAVEGLCKNNHEKAVVLTMKALHTLPLDLQDIKKIYQLDPSVEGVGVLINREINKLEKLYLSKIVKSQNPVTYSPYDWQKPPSKRTLDSLGKIYIPYIQKLNGFLDQLIKDKKAENPALWHLCKAYLSGMQNNTKVMNSQLVAAKSAGLSPSERVVYNMVHLLYTLYKTPNITKKTEADLLPQLKKLNNLAQTSHMAAWQFRDIMSSVVAGKYFRQGDTIKGIYTMAHAKADNYWWRKGNKRQTFFADPNFEDQQGRILKNMSQSELKSVIAFRKNPNKNPFEKWLVTGVYYTANVLKELKGVKYIRNQQFDKAVAVFSTIKSNLRKFPDPFMPHIDDIHHLMHRDTIRQYTRLSFSRRMAELKAAITKDPHDAGALYGYALALYNTSYYGKSADITSYIRHPTDPNAYFQGEKDKNWSKFFKDYYHVYEAEKYFKKAAMAAQKPELKAKALWGAAKCWEKRCPIVSKNNNHDYFLKTTNYDFYYLNALKNPYFKPLKQDYAQTHFMDKVRRTCDYYSDYLTQQK